jgi:hypothetical protein
MTSSKRIGCQLDLYANSSLPGSTSVVPHARAWGCKSTILEKILLSISSVPLATFWDMAFDGAVH